MEVVIDKLMAFLPNRPSVMTMDVGIIDFTVYRNHDIEPHVPNLRFIRLHAKCLQRFQKVLSRKQYSREKHIPGQRTITGHS